jgi:hypothetical protein
MFQSDSPAEQDANRRNVRHARRGLQPSMPTTWQRRRPGSPPADPDSGQPAPRGICGMVGGG